MHHVTHQDVRVNCYPGVQTLAEVILNAYQAAQFDQRVLDGIAAQALAQFDQHASINETLVWEWLMSNPDARQFNRVSTGFSFGQPPVTLFYHPHFLIDAYFWMDNHTDIHDHAFCGAFLVVEGQTHHVRYHFEMAHAVSPVLQIGSMHETHRANIVTRGEVIRITPGNTLIHSTEHLKMPTVTLLVRTPDYQGLRQYGYYPCGIALSGSISSGALQKLQLLLIRQHKGESCLKQLITLIDRVSALDAFYLVVHYSNHRPSCPDIPLLIRAVAGRFPKLAEKLTQLVFGAQ